ncbi:succinate-semialdehyde dehydrogenase, mitochondrial isoform X2 [Hyposmocoma kahamanoa]|uniref:succinate-semialdehyde dehydrogenase, mitochondrial isoform X2 n=1 Tax=Hyposmocoma kahamanoa TaxID=1477025 RepID=UPI000E6D6A18|nr:succinate-semialdehyde dehydrogenase, mitochondrial isoform X2 [Hyposmocoma kahamanoa]
MELIRVNTSMNLNKFLILNRRLHLLKSKAYINGDWVNAQSNKTFSVLDPSTDKPIGTVPDMDATDAKRAVDAAAEAFKTWRNTTAKERSYVLRRWFGICKENRDNVAAILTAEAGKPLSESLGEFDYGNAFLEFFADTARHINGEIVSSPWPNKQILITRQPLGVVSVITPWNFPYAMITRKVGALMAAGCTCVIKPSEDTPLTALVAAQLAEQAGVPKGVINVITSSRENAAAVGKVMCQDPNVGCVSFTGSTFVGKILYGLAASGVKRVALELGGNAPFIVFPSADLEYTVDQALLAKFRNAGQACVGANRFLIHKDVFDEFVTIFKNKISAKVEIGGKYAKQFGTNFYEATLLVGVKPDMKIYSQEIFGPVAVCSKFNTEDEALQIANNTRSGLASYVFTKDLGQAFRMSRELEFGMVAINDGILSAPEPPFGGIKESGIGREGSRHGVEEYTDIKYTLFSGLAKGM